MHTVCVLCFVFWWWYSGGGIISSLLNQVMYLPIAFRVTSLALGQSHDCPSASEVTLKYKSKTERHLTTTKHSKPGLGVNYQEYSCKRNNLRLHLSLNCSQCANFFAITIPHLVVCFNQTNLWGTKPAYFPSAEGYSFLIRHVTHEGMIRSIPSAKNPWRHNRNCR